MKGSCFCETVQFEVSGPIPGLYQCHCSMCRKVTGAAANAAFLIPKQQLQWLAGGDQIKTYRKPTGYCVSFCTHCGSTVPNIFRDTQYWVPAGLLESDEGLEVKQHICVASKAEWDEIGGDAHQYDALPE
ncbi:GFA family protein [Spongorhabdus nitratireducens]